LVKLDLNAKGEPPSEFRIFAAGANRTTRGTFEFSSKAAESVMAAAADYANDYPVDYAHAMFSSGGLFGSPDPAAAGAAAGWFKPVVREGALYATECSWTPRAAKMLADREYRYTSPAFLHAEDGTITELLNVALTNVPAGKGITPLMADQLPRPETMPMKGLLALLSLKADATEADAVVALNSIVSDRAALLSEIGVATVSEAKGRITGLKLEADKAVALAKQLGELVTASRKGEVAAMLAKAVEEKKVAPAELELLTKLGERDPAELKGMLDVRSPMLNPPSLPPNGGGTGMVAGLTREEREVAELMGVNLEALAKSKVTAKSTIPAPAPAA